MARLNEVKLLGNLGDDPQYKKGEDGKASICTIKLMVNRRKPKEGEAGVDGIYVKFFGKTADTAGTYLKKGSGILVDDAQLRVEPYEKEGKTLWPMEVVGNSFQFLDKAEK